MSINLNQCVNACHDCVKQYICKHKIRRGENKKFEIECGGIPLKYIPDSIVAGLGGDTSSITAMLDPVSWASKYLDWHCIDPDGEIWKRKTAEGSLPSEARPYDPVLAKQGKSIFHRPYQFEMLNCTSRRKVLRIGRQAGKSECLCIAILYTLWTKENFRIVLIAPYQAQIEMLFGRLSKFIQENPMLNNSIAHSVKAPSYKIELNNGSQLIGFTAGTRSGQDAGAARGQPANMLVFDEADYLCLHPEESFIELDNGHICTIEEFSKNENFLHCLNNQTLDSCFEKCSWKSFRKESKLLKIKSSYSQLKSTKDHIHIVASDNGIVEKRAENLSIGDYFIHPVKGVIGNRNIDNNACKLIGYYYGDGNYEKAGLEFTDKDIQNLQSYKNMAIELGFQNKGTIRKFKNSNGYNLRLSSLPFRDYLFNIFLGARNKIFDQAITTLNEKSLGSFLSGFYDAEGSVNLKRSSIVVSQGNLKTILIIRQLLHKLGILSSLSEHSPSGFGKNPVYQLSIAEDRFVKLFSKHIGFSSKAKKEKLEIILKERKIKNNNYSNLKYHRSYFADLFIKIKNQVKIKFKGKQIVFDSLNRGIDPTLNSIEKLISGLFDIKEDSLASELVAKTNIYMSKINSINEIENDFDYVVDIKVPKTSNFICNGSLTHNSPNDIGATLATIINSPTATVWMSSTPTGRREKFYETCLSPLYKEFYFPSHVNPNFGESEEKYYRSEYTEEQYKHECLAEFGEQEEGVYQVKYVEAAQANYTYEQMRPIRSWTYMMGVDWNDVKIGTTIAVVGFNPQDGKFRIVDKHTISKGERTQLSACDKIAELNRIWFPDYIYVDEGFGTAQVEVLHGFGYQAVQTHGPNSPDARLRQIVKAYGFGRAIEIHDLFTKQPVKKPAKPFLVENSVRRFETLQIQYPKADTQYTAQLLGYTIQRVSMTGLPIYQANERAGDHFLDAVNLALVAFVLEKSAFGKPKFSCDIALAGKFGDSEGPSFEKSVVERVSKNTSPDRATLFKKEERLVASTPPLPANNTSKTGNLPLWSWPGWSRDLPAPQPKSHNSRRQFRPKRVKF